MRVIDPGHKYALETFDGDGLCSELVFVKRIGEKFPGNKTAYPGTQIQEVVRACIDRLKYLNKQEYSAETKLCISLFRTVLFILETRARRKKEGLFLEVPQRVHMEDLPTDERGHV